MRSIGLRSIAMAGLLLAFGCAGGVSGAGAQTNVEQFQATPARVAIPSEPVAAPPRPIAAAGPEYRVGPGDRIRIIVFGQQDLGGEFQLSLWRELLSVVISVLFKLHFENVRKLKEVVSL